MYYHQQPLEVSVEQKQNVFFFLLKITEPLGQS